jgi:hypothetical protein
MFKGGTFYAADDARRLRVTSAGLNIRVLRLGIYRCILPCQRPKFSLGVFATPAVQYGNYLADPNTSATKDLIMKSWYCQVLVALSNSACPFPLLFRSLHHALALASLIVSPATLFFYLSPGHVDGVT